MTFGARSSDRGHIVGPPIHATPNDGRTAVVHGGVACCGGDDEPDWMEFARIHPRTADTMPQAPPPPAALPAAPPPAPAPPPPGTPFPNSQVPAWGTPDQETFMRAVYDAHVAHALAQHRVFRTGLPSSQLATVEGHHRMRTDAAPFCRQLLARARTDRTAAAARGDALAAAASGIGIRSAHRTASEELGIWAGLFPRYYRDTASRRAAAPGGPHGAAAVAIMVRHYSGRKAAPGFSNHTNGIAVDFTTTQGGTSLGAEESQAAAWMASWLHRWLVSNAATFHFRPLSTEAWHWDYRF